MTERDTETQGQSAQRQPGGRLHQLADFLFRNRSYTPIPLAIVLVWQAEISYPLLLPGLVLIIGGELLRLSAVRSFGRGSFRTRRVKAHELVTWGLYAHMRNPLYVGNLFLWVGAVLFAGGPYVLWLMAAVVIFFLLQYSLIILLEERALLDLFGDSYIEYRRSVPRLIPRLRRSGTAADTPGVAVEKSARSWRYALRHERSTLMAIIAVILLVLLSTYLKT